MSQLTAPYAASASSHIGSPVAAKPSHRSPCCARSFDHQTGPPKKLSAPACIPESHHHATTPAATRCAGRFCALYAIVRRAGMHPSQKSNARCRESICVCSYSVEISDENGNCMKPSKFLFRLTNQIRTDQNRRLGKRDRKGNLINRDWNLNHLQPWILQQMQRLRDRARESARTNRLFALPWELRTRILQLGRELGAATLIQRLYRGYSARSRGVARWAEVPYFSSWDRDDVSQRRAVTKWAPVVYLF